MASSLSSVAGSGGQHAAAGTPGSAPSQYRNALPACAWSVPPAAHDTATVIALAPAGTGTTTSRGTSIVGVKVLVPCAPTMPGTRNERLYVWAGCGPAPNEDQINRACALVGAIPAGKNVSLKAEPEPIVPAKPTYEPHAAGSTDGVGATTGVPAGGAGAAGRAVSAPELHLQSWYHARCCTRSPNLASPESKSAPRLKSTSAFDSAAVNVGIAGGSVAQNVLRTSSGNDRNGIAHLSHPAP